MIQRRHQKIVAACILAAAAAIEIPLLLHKSHFPALFERYSIRAFIIIVILGLSSLTLTLLALKSSKVAHGLPLALTSIIIAVLLIEIAVRLIAPGLPDAAWGHLPYTVRLATIDSREEVSKASEFIEWDGMFSRYKPNVCIDFENIEGPEETTILICHDEIGYRNPPGTYTSNEQIEIVTLGDSFTHNSGVYRAWPDILRDKMETTVINLAGPGGSPQSWVEAFTRYGIQKSPRLVIVGTWDSNDFTDAARWKHAEQAGGDYINYWYSLTYYDGSDVLRRLANFSFAANIMQEIRDGRIRLVNSNFEGKTEQSAIDNGKTMVQIDIGRHVPNFELLSSEPASSGLSEYELSLRKVRDLSQEVDAHMVVVYFSTASVIYSPYFTAPSPIISGDVRNQQILSEWLEDKSREIGFLYIDTVPQLQIDAGRSPVLYNDHFTQAGNDRVADIIVSVLEQEGVLP